MVHRHQMGLDHVRVLSIWQCLVVGSGNALVLLVLLRVADSRSHWLSLILLICRVVLELLLVV